jgi:Family of unknown function (DUF6527)
MRFISARQNRARLKGVVPSHREATALVTQPGDVAIVKRNTLRSAVMGCPDGCGEVITLNLDPRTDKAWRIYKSPRGLTLFPSIWRDTGCKSHFVLWNSVISWADLFETVEEDARDKGLLKERVWAVLKLDAFADFVQIADALEEIPWAVLDACRQLVKEHRAVAGCGPMKSAFRKSGSDAPADANTDQFPVVPRG